MEILDVQQGSEEWQSERLKSICASEAPMIMSCSPYVTRDELLKYKKTGVSKIVTSFQQKIFDSGHESEANARPIVESSIGEELFPIVGVRTIEGVNSRLLASYDGLTMFHEIGFEHKDYNYELFENVRHQVLPDDKIYQLEHQLLVSNDDCKQIIFVCSDGTDNPERRAEMVYTSKPEYRQKLINEIKRFENDLENYEVKAIPEKVEVEKRDSLPVAVIDVEGKVLATNMDEFKQQATAFISSINTELNTDAQFKQAEEDIKACEAAEKQLKAAKERALSQTGDISELFSVVDDISEQIRQARLKCNRQVTARKDERKKEIVAEYQKKLDDYYIQAVSDHPELNTPSLDFNFNEAIKGKSNFANMEKACQKMLTDTQESIDNYCEIIRTNLEAKKTFADGYDYLFNDLSNLINLEPSHFELEVKNRVREQKELEEKKAAYRKAADDDIRAIKEMAPNVPENPEEAIAIYNEVIADLDSKFTDATIYGEHYREVGDAKRSLISELQRDKQSCQSMIDEILQAQQEQLGDVEKAESELNGQLSEAENVPRETSEKIPPNHDTQNMAMESDKEKMPDAVLMGEHIYTVDDPNDDSDAPIDHGIAMVIEFDSKEQMKKALADRQIQFTVLGS